MEGSGSKLTESELKLKIGKFCAYRERCHKEVKDRLIELGANYEQADRIIVELIEQNFLNEERYARALCRGKFLHNKWGRNKIMQVLLQNRISDYCIRKGMEEIHEHSYQATLKDLLEKELHKHRSLNRYTQKHKAAKALASKGYELDLIWEILGRN